MTISSHGLRPAAVFRSSSGLRQTALNRAQPRAEILPGHDRVQDNQRVLLGIETAIAHVKIEETGLPHSCPPRYKTSLPLPPPIRAVGTRSIFRGALKINSPNNGKSSSCPPTIQRQLP